ncbi:uncharacterized, partial [Tachysurus ichikawai]
MMSANRSTGLVYFSSRAWYDSWDSPVSSVPPLQQLALRGAGVLIFDHLRQDSSQFCVRGFSVDNEGVVEESSIA